VQSLLAGSKDWTGWCHDQNWPLQTHSNKQQQCSAQHQLSMNKQQDRTVTAPPWMPHQQCAAITGCHSTVWLHRNSWTSTFS